MSLEDYYSTGPPFERPIFDAVMRSLEPVGPVHIEPVSVGVFLKRARSFAELRPMTKWVAIGFSLSRQVRHPLIVRKPIPHGGRFWHVANVSSAAELDDALIECLTEAYLECPPA